MFRNIYSIDIFILGVDWDRLLKWVDEKLIDVAEIDWAEPGPEEAINAINSFIEKRLKSYASSRNDPAVDAQSNLSPYFHYGNVAAQRVALQVKPLRNKHPESVGKNYSYTWSLR